MKSNILNIEENKLSEMKRSARIVDPFLHWREPSPAADFLLENSDFLVVGVIGQQGVGKSSLMSLLGGSTWRDKVCKHPNVTPQCYTVHLLAFSLSTSRI